jgi:hypothetical protein
MSKRLTTEEFIKKATALFGKRYDYSEVIYLNSITPIVIKCRKHGYLKNMTPNKHLRRDGGCPECKKEKAQKKYVMPIDEYINRANSIHQDRYDYKLVHQFKNQHEKIKLICNDCSNTFNQSAMDHLAGKGCNNKKCISKKITNFFLLSQEEFISRAYAIHGRERYSYKNATYKGTDKKISILCNLCRREFSQTPNAHINQQQGCPSCGDEINRLGDNLKNLIKNKVFIEGNLYVIECYSNKESFFKIGISVKRIGLRFSGSKLPYDYDIVAEIPIGLIEAYQQERYFLEEYKKYSYIPDLYFSGYTECFSVNPVEVDERLKEIYENYYQ